jgi:hypothetical protein
MGGDKARAGRVGGIKKAGKTVLKLNQLFHRQPTNGFINLCPVYYVSCGISCGFPAFVPA